MNRSVGHRVAVVLLALLGAALVVPIAAGAWVAIVDAMRATPRSAPPMGNWGWVALRTAAYPLGIGVIATALALPVAWVLRGGLSAAAQCLCFALALVPLMLPNYLAFAGWTLVRAPGTWLGDKLERGPEWTNLLAGRVLAVMGLSLWAWPAAALVLTAALGALPQSQVDALRLHAGRRRVAWEIVKLIRRPVAASVLLVALMMVGSPVPLHLAQAETLGVRLMAGLALTSKPGEVWLQSWPLVAVALAAAWFISGRAAGGWWRGQEPADATIARPRRTMGAIGTGVWLVAVIVPLVLFALSLRRALSVWLFWKENAASVRDSGWIALATGGVVGVIALTTWAVLGITRRSSGAAAARVVLAVLLVTALLPGVLVGSAVRSFFNAPWTGGLGDAVVGSGWIVVLAHAARFGFIGAACGWWLASLEPLALRDARRLAGGETLSGWWRLAARPRVAAVVGVALAAAALSLHEIESTVQVYPASQHPALAQQVLDALHYLKQEQTSAAAIGMVLMALVAAVGAAACLSVTAVSRVAKPDAGPFRNETDPAKLP
ncbi:MAG: hypothetical protein ACREJO_08480 [Phycisphaerales bacterium]